MNKINFTLYTMLMILIGFGIGYFRRKIIKFFTRINKKI